MKKLIIPAVVAIFLLTTGTANAFSWSRVANTLINKQYPTVKTDPTVNLDVQNALNNLVSQSQAIDTSVEKSFMSLVSQLSDETSANSMQNTLNSILANQYSNSNETGLQLASMMSAYTNNLKSNKTDVASRISNMSDIERALLIKNITGMAQSGQQYTDLAKQALTTANTAAKAAKNARDVIQTVTTVRQTALNIKNRATSVINMINQIRSIAQYAGISL